MFPILSRMCRENWRGLSVLYICPLKALLNNLSPRLEEYTRMIGRRADVWHGDVSASHRNRIKGDPPDILLTTPESLEVMLISAKDDGREMLRDVQVVIIDEIHAFAGDDRGWHLLAVLERIGRLAKREIQRIGLSATVGNPRELLQWLAGHCEGQRSVVQAASPVSPSETDVQLDYVGSLENAAIVISRLFCGEKRLVFCDSRSRVEELGNRLRHLGTSVFLSHSSLSAEERRASEQAFTETQNCVILATSTLELGIDVGDLDRVIQIDAPWSVASFLQRIGRSGRRAGSVRNCLFLATSENALLRAGALLELWNTGFVEPVSPPPRPLHLFAQQLMALALQEKGIGIRDWPHWIGRLPWIQNDVEFLKEKVVQYLIETRILYSDEARLSFGDAGESLYGRKNFLELVSIFTSDPVFKVKYGQRELGAVDQITFMRHREEEPVVLSLGGKSWQVVSLDWPRREAFVIPSESTGKSRWQSGRNGISFRVARAIHSLLTRNDESPLWTKRARTAFATIRDDHAFLNAEKDVVVSDREEVEVRWYTFAGTLINTAIADSLDGSGWKHASVNDFMIKVTETIDGRSVTEAIRAKDALEIYRSFKVSEEFLDNLKFNECLPVGVGHDILRKRLLQVEAVEAVINGAVVEVIC